MSSNTIDILKERLVPYLADRGVDVVSKNFRCISGVHEDRNPSCGIIPASKGTVFHCFSCLTSGNIFTAAHFMENLPIEGPDFWKITVPTLAERFGIEYTQEELSPADKERHQLLSAHRDAADVVLSSICRADSRIHEYSRQRGWSQDTLKECGVGCVDSFTDYMMAMKSLGWSEEYLRRSHLADPNMFHPNNILFILKDLNGRPVAFASRDMTWTDGDHRPKYVNSPESSIYNKASTLFLLDKCLREDGPLWIVEGYADAITTRQAGLRKVCAIGGVYFTGPDEMHPSGANHLDILLDNDLTNVILCLDGDDGGKRGITKALSEHFPKAPTILVRVCPLEDGDDPDDVVKNGNVEDLTRIPLMTPFAWKLAGISHTSDPRQIVEDMVPVISQETNSLTRWEMCRDLSSRSGVPLTFISDEVTAQSSSSRDDAKKKISAMVRDLQKRLIGYKDPEATAGIVSDAASKMMNVLENTTGKQVKPYVERVSSARNFIMGDHSSRRLSIGKYKQLEQALKMFPTDGQLMILAGPPNVGKSSWFRNLSWELVRSNENIHVVYMSIDDSFQRALQGYVSLYTQIDQEEIIDKVALAASPAKKEAVWMGYDYLQKLSHKLVIKDSTDGDTITAMERSINRAIADHSDKSVILIVDSFNKLVEVSSGLDEPGKIAEACDRIKKMAVKYCIPIVMNVELRKTDWTGRPTLRDMKGTAAIEYDADLAMIMHQPMHQDRDTRMIWSPGGNKGPMPINELEVQKNKITGYKGSIYYKFLPSRSRMDEMAEMTVLPLVEEERKRVYLKGRTYDKRKTGRSTDGSGATNSNVEGSGSATS